MNNDGLQRLQQIAADAKERMGPLYDDLQKLKQGAIDAKNGLPEPNLDPMRDMVEKLRIIEQAASSSSKLQALEQAASPRPMVTMNRKQRRSKGQKAKRPNADPTVHAYAERVRRMSDKQIWDEGHKLPGHDIVEQVALDIHEDILSVLAPHFDDHTMARIATVLGDWYGFNSKIIFRDGNTTDDSERYVPVAHTEGGRNVIAIGQVYRHFKGNYYRVTALAKMATSMELEDADQRLDGMDVVVYQSMNPAHPDWFFTRPVAEFTSPTPEKYLLHDKSLQPWRFVLVKEKEVATNA